MSTASLPPQKLLPLSPTAVDYKTYNEGGSNIVSFRFI